MPELPEVETTVRGLKPLVGSSIITIKIHTPKIRFFIPKSITTIKGNTKIIKINRMAKFILINLSNNYTIVIHLGMSGRLRLFDNAKYTKKKHDHFILGTNKEHLLVFNDARRFGFIDFDQKNKILLKKYILNLGIEALDNKLTGEYLFKKINNKIVAIKQILLDQTIISGIGNIYASEILFNARISPLLRGKDLNLQECKKIVNSTKKILKKAVNQGGSSLKDFVSADGTLGNFQNNFKVYSRGGKTIYGKKIEKIVQYGRSTYFCPDIQKKN